MTFPNFNTFLGQIQEALKRDKTDRALEILQPMQSAGQADFLNHPGNASRISLPFNLSTKHSFNFLDSTESQIKNRLHSGHCSLVVRLTINAAGQPARLVSTLHVAACLVISFLITKQITTI